MIPKVKISKFGFLCVVAYVLAALIARLVLPFGDEPDWSVRAPELLRGIDNFFSPHYLFQSIVQAVDITASDCAVNASPLSVSASIPDGCYSDYSDSFSRFMLTVVMLAPLFIILTFRPIYFQLRAFFRKPYLYGASDGQRLDAVALSLLFPGFIYYLGVFSNEQFFLVVAIYIFLFIDVWAILLGIMFLLFIIDLGNFLVVLSFVIWFRISKYIVYNFGVKYYYLVSGLAVIFSYLVGYYLLVELTFVSMSLGFDGVADKSDAIFNSLDGSIYLNNYPVFLRPVITFMTFVFMTPASLKAPLLYIFVAIYVSFITYRILKMGRMELVLFWFAPIVIILCFTFLFPTHSNAKYYIFMLPFFIFSALSIFSRYRIFGFFSFMVFLWLSQILLYRL